MTLEFIIAKTEEELKMAFQVRYQVFGKECNYLKLKNYADEIEFDRYDFLNTTTNFIALDGEIPIATARISKKNQKIAEEDGTYFGLPIEHLFDLSICKKLNIPIGEISRSAVLNKYRGSNAIMNIWGNIIEFAKEQGLKHLFTNSNMETDYLKDAQLIYKLAKEQGQIHPIIKTPPRKKVANFIKTENIKFRLFKNGELPKLPNTLQMYIKIGTKFTSPPIYYPEFDMCSILALLEYDKINQPYSTYFKKKWKKFNQKSNL